MSIFSRVADILSANVNDLLDRAEDPEKMVKMLVLEMEQRIEEARAGVAKAVAGEKQLEASLAKNREQAAQWQAKAEAAIDRNDDELARRCLERKKEFDAIAGSLQPQWEAARRTGDALKADFRRLEEKLDETRRKRDALIARKLAAEAQREVASVAPSMSSIEATFGKFDKMERRIEQMEAEAAAMAELSAERRNLEREVASLERQEEVEIELAALKRQRQKPTPGQTSNAS